MGDEDSKQIAVPFMNVTVVTIETVVTVVLIVNGAGDIGTFAFF